MTNPFLTHHEKAVHTRWLNTRVSLTGPEMTHKQNFLQKSTRCLIMYSVNTPQTCYKHSRPLSRQLSATAAHVACSSHAQPSPIVPPASSCHKRLLHQSRDQNWARDRMQHFDCKRFSLTRLHIILRCRIPYCDGFAFQILDHRQLSFLVFRLRSTPLSLDDAASHCNSLPSNWASSSSLLQPKTRLVSSSHKETCYWFLRPRLWGLWHDRGTS